MKLKDIGFNEAFDRFRVENKLTDFEVGRIVAEHKERYLVKTQNSELDAEITGSMRFTAKSREDFPAVGDWVALTMYENDFGIIHTVFPRQSAIKRQAVAQHGEVQIIATNIDYAFVVQAVDRDFNINRLERYLTICYSSQVSPIIVLTKTDLITTLELSDIKENINKRIKDVPTLALSSKTGDGHQAVRDLVQPGKTYCMLGSSGVGKSTLANKLSGDNRMRTDTISCKTNKGRHITSHRQLIIMDNGGLLIDNPGMREVGIADSDNGLKTAFNSIVFLSQKCRFGNCTHTSERGCAVLEALENEDIDRNSYNNYMKMKREQAHFEATVEEKRKKDRDFGKMIKNYKNSVSRNCRKQ